VSAMALTEESLGVEQKRAAQTAMFPLLGYLVFSTAVFVAVDIFAYDDDVLFLLSTIAVWIAGYILLVVLMRATDPQGEAGLGGIGGYFGLSILTGIAIGVGLIIFVLPGLYLFMRWLPAYARMQATGDGILASMQWSWDNTQQFQKPLAIALVWPVGLYGIAFLILLAQEYQTLLTSDLAYNASVVAVNLVISVIVAWLQLLGVVAYRMIERHLAAPIETFS